MNSNTMPGRRKQLADAQQQSACCTIGIVLIALVTACVASAEGAGSPSRRLQQEGAKDTGAGFVPSGRMCEEGGYCSVGHSKFWTGDIQNSAALKEMLEAVSYKKELIITPLSSSDEQSVWLDPILQLHWELEEAGYAHLVVHTTQPTTCAQLHQYRNVSCIWDASPSLKGHADDRHGIWYIRWKFFARVGRMGYNVMNVDGDTIFFRDPYVHIKRKPMSDIQMWCNPEGGGALHCNGGFMYIQNLRPDGPIAWVFKMVVDDQMWMMDDGYAFVMSQGGRPGNCHSYDQELIFDGVKSAFIGRPMPYDFVVDCHDSNWTTTNRLGAAITKEQILNNHKVIMGNWREDYYNESQFLPPPDWMPAGMDLPSEYTKHLVNRLTVPNLAYGWAAELGGRLGPEQRGPYTAAWLSTLKSDCPDCPWWNDNRPIKGGRDQLDVMLGPNLDGVGGKFVNELLWDDDVPVELLGIGPAWLSNSLCGFRNGMWSGHGELGIGHTTAIAHVHHWTFTSSWHKTVVRKITSRYDWDLGALTSANNTPYTSGYPVTRVLALHPSIDLGRTRSLEEYNRIVLGLIQIAQMTHRTVLFPDVPCEAPWLHGVNSRDRPACKPMEINWNNDRYGGIWNMPYAVEQTTRQLNLRQIILRPVNLRQMVGGWMKNVATGARRLLNIAVPTTPTTTDANLIPDPIPDPTTSDDLSAFSYLPYVVDATTGLPAELGPEGLPTSVRGGDPDQNAPVGQPPLLTRLRRRLLQAVLYRTPEQRANFWSDKKFMFSISWNADYPCTREIGNPGGIMLHELAHWMTTPAAQNASWTPDETNTVLLPEQGEGDHMIKLLPVAPPEHGYLHKPSNDLGWSVGDTQVLLPLGQTMREMSRFAHMPVVYLGHPVALISSEERHKRGDTVDHGVRPQAGGLPFTLTADGKTEPLHSMNAAGGEGGGRRAMRGYDGVDWNNHKASKLIGEDTSQTTIRRGGRLNLEELNKMLQETMDRFRSSGCKVQYAKTAGNPYDNSAFMDTQMPTVPLGVVTDHKVRLWRQQK